MYAKKNKKPMYGKGGAIKYQDGGQGPDLFGIDAVLEAREKAKNDPNYDPFGLKELVPAAKERISNQMKEAGDSFEEKREAVLNYLVDLFNPSSEKKMMNGGMMPRKYEQGGPVGSASSDQKFRVIPEKSPTGQTELAYYIDGRPAGSQDFQQQFYDAGNKPQDLNQLIENSVIASKQGIGADSGIPSGSPLEGLMKQYRDALKERNVYREKGAAGVDSLYNARNENYDRMIRQMGG